MINIRSIHKLKNNDGLTLKNGKPTVYKTGWQVATDGIATTDPREAAFKNNGYECYINAIKAD